MAHTETFDVIREAIVHAMRGMPQAAARQLAAEITTLINDGLAATAPATSTGRAARLVPESVRNTSTLSVGWEVYRTVFAQESQATDRPTHVSVLCTLPPAFRSTAAVREMSTQTGIWAGTLMQTVYELIQTAEHEVVIVAPYWSPQGVQELLRYVTRPTMKGVDVIILTQPENNLSPEGRQAIYMLKTRLADRHANVTALSPVKENGQIPLLHAKAVVRDGAEAYLGSANYSSGGVEQSFELGVRLHGAQVIGLREWLGVLIAQFEPW